MSQTPIQRATQLREQLERAAEAYYNRDEQLIPDAEYDALLRELEALEAEHPQLKVEDSISGRIGGRASGRFAEVTHALPMLSLGNAFSEGGQTVVFQLVVQFVQKFHADDFTVAPFATELRRPI